MCSPLFFKVSYLFHVLSDEYIYIYKDIYMCVCVCVCVSVSVVHAMRDITHILDNSCLLEYVN